MTIPIPAWRSLCVQALLTVLLTAVPAQRDAQAAAGDAVDALRDHVGTLHADEFRPTRRWDLLAALENIDALLAVPDACAASDAALDILDDIAMWVDETAGADPAQPQAHRRAVLADLRERVLRLRVALLAASPPGQGCGGGATVAVDPDLEPVMPSIAHFAEDGDPRPLAALRNARGVVTNFVANELWLVTDTAAQADAAAADMGADIILSLWSGPSLHSLLRVDGPAGDADALPALLAALKPGVTDAIALSSPEARDLLALAAAQAAAGRRVGFNLVGLPQDIRDGFTVDAALGPDIFSATGSWSRNAFDWVHLSDAGTQAIGVPEAWRLLDNLGLLAPASVPIGIIDGGYLDNDLPPESIYRSTLAGVEALGGANPFSAWHGTYVAQTAAAVVDNDFGGAGVAGPVARPVNVFAGGDFFAGAMVGTRTAIDNGAVIVNLSSNAPVPSIVDWLTLPFRAYTGELQGTVFIGSAGNEGPEDDDEAPADQGDVDSLECFLGSCWESTFHTPCENPGVICVGGLALNSLNVSSGSSFGTEHSDSMLGNESVDLYAPFCTLVDGIDTPNEVEFKCGTSFSAPYVAGVAALMLAADPTLSKDFLALVLRNTARTDSPDARVHRIVDAEAAVRLSLLPAINITEPADGAALPQGVDVTFTAYRYPEGLTTEITWSSDVQGVLGTGLSLTTDVLSAGPHVITASDGVLSDAIDVFVTTIGILSPADGAGLITNAMDADGRYVLQELSGVAYDAEDGELTGASLVWTDRVNGGPAEVLGTGKTLSVKLYADGNAAATHEITLTATDSDGNAQTYTVTVTVDVLV